MPSTLKRAPKVVPIHLGLVGTGIERSPSAPMQRAALEARGLVGDYTLLPMLEPELPEVLSRVRTGELTGLNVTVPHKAAVAELCDRLDGDAAVCRAVNTVLRRDGQLVGDNTDARGFELALTYLRLLPDPSKPALILGAGGAAAAVLLALCRLGVEEVVVAARRPEMASDMCLRGSPEAARALGWGQEGVVRVAAESAGVVVNATAAALADLPLSVEWLDPGCVVADLRYRPRPVDLVAAAVARGLRAPDGVEMLLFQGMLSFQLWTGSDPPWHAAGEALKAALDG